MLSRINAKIKSSRIKSVLQYIGNTTLDAEKQKMYILTWWIQTVI